MDLCSDLLLYLDFQTLTILEQKTQQQETDLRRQREEFEKERQLELERIEAEKNKLKELENQER